MLVRAMHLPRHSVLLAVLATLSLLTAAAPADAQIPSDDEPRSFVAGGILKQGDHAVVLAVDAELLLPPLMLGYRHGLLDGLELGAELGGDKGLFLALVTAKKRLVERNGGYWGLRLRGGYKSHDWSAGEIVFDDESVVISLEHAAALRLGQRRDMALYINSFVYFDIDVRSPQRQTDVYLAPASLGFEALLGSHFSVYIELGFAIGLNGTETYKGKLFVSDIFPIGEIGLALVL